MCFDADYKVFEVAQENVFPMNPANMEGVRDNTELMYLHDPSLLHNIKVGVVWCSKRLWLVGGHACTAAHNPGSLPAR